MSNASNPQRWWKRNAWRVRITKQAEKQRRRGPYLRELLLGATMKFQRETAVYMDPAGGPRPLWREIRKRHPNYPNCGWQKGLAIYLPDRERRKWVLEFENRSPESKNRGKPFAATDAFLDTYAWRELRMRVLRHYGVRCLCCGATPKDGAVIHVDHIKPRLLYPELALEFSNCQPMCSACNHGKGNWDQTDWRQPQPPKGNEPPPTLN